MNIQHQRLLRTATSCSATMILLASIQTVQAEEKLAIHSVASSDTTHATRIASMLEERLADQGITVPILIPKDGIAGIPVEKFVAKDLPDTPDTSSSIAEGFHLEIVPTWVVKEDTKSLGSTYSLASLSYGRPSDATLPEKDTTQFAALPLKYVEYANKGEIPSGFEVDYRPIPALLGNEADVSVGTKFKLATAVASISSDSNSLTINGIPLKDQKEAIDVLADWHASTAPWADPLDPSIGAVEETSSYEDLGSWYEGRDVGRQPTEFWQWRKKM